MALKVWLPLDGDLRNLGCSDVTITNGGTIDNNGKIGKCYKNVNATLTNLGGIKVYPMTICFWMKTADASSAWQKIFMIDNESNSQIHGIYVADSARIKYESNPSLNVYNATPTTWHHYCFIINSGNSTAYYDGTLIATSTETVTADIIGRLRIGTGANIYLNDVRIYDHCLSAAEVHEIAMGLVLHYKLDGNDIPNENLGNTSADYSNQTNSSSRALSSWGGDAGTVTFYHSGGYAGLPYKVYHKTASGNGGVYYKTANDIILEANTTYTMSCWIKSSREFSGAAYGFCINRGTDNFYITYDNPISFKTEWTFYSKTFTTNDSQNGNYGEMGIIYDDGVEDYYVYYSGFKIEKGSTATRWTPPGEQYNIIQDSSGYGHNGEVINEVIISLDTPRYNSSIQLNGSNAAIKVSDNKWIAQSAEAITINLWAKSSAWTGAHLFSCTESGGFNTEAGNSGYLRFPVFVYTNEGKTSLSYKYDSKEIQISELSTTDWNMLTFVYDSTGTRTYINGKLHHTYINTSYGIYFNPNASLFLGCEANGASPSSPYFNGQISDFRIYYTPLLDTDIKMLYNVGMKVDNLGEVHTFEFKEAGGRELIQGIQLTHSYGNHDENSNPYLNYNSDGEIILTGSSSIGSKYIPTSPTGKTYYYDIEVSIAADNQFYFGFERYDVNKTARSNNACTYVIVTKPTSNLSHKRYFGTVDLSTDGTNPCAFIAVRILNDWSNGSGRTAIIHRMSLREVSTFQKPKLYKTGTFLVDELNEHQKAAFHNNNIVEATEFIEE